MGRQPPTASASSGVSSPEGHGKWVVGQNWAGHWAGGLSVGFLYHFGRTLFHLTHAGATSATSPGRSARSFASKGLPRRRAPHRAGSPGGHRPLCEVRAQLAGQGGRGAPAPGAGEAAVFRSGTVVVERTLSSQTHRAQTYQTY